MFATTVIWTFLKDNWMPILIGIVMLGALGRYEVVIAERNHYKAQVSELRGQIETSKTKIAELERTIIATNNQAKAQQEAANKAAAEITDKYRNALNQNEHLLAKNRDLNDRRIRDEKELASVKLSLRAVQLFNASKESPSASSGVPASSAKPGDVKVTTPSGKVVTLADMLVVVNHNDTNHLDCIAQVKAWQNFWNDVQTKYNAALNAGTQ